MRSTVDASDSAERRDAEAIRDDLQPRGHRVDGHLRPGAPHARRAGGVDRRALGRPPGDRRRRRRRRRSSGSGRSRPYTDRARPTRRRSRTRSTCTASTGAAGIGRLLLDELVRLGRDHGFHSVDRPHRRRPRRVDRAPRALRLRARRHRARGRPQVRPVARRRRDAEDALSDARTPAATAGRALGMVGRVGFEPT